MGDAPVQTKGAAPWHAEWLGTSRYLILRRLGVGGMGVVFEALDRECHERVALKLLARFDAASLYMFKKEFPALADVRHHNLVHLHELVARDDGPPFFTMELVSGTDFLSHVQRPLQASPDTIAMASRDVESGTDLDRLRSALRQLVEGLCALHSAGKLHRDIKPANVLVTPQGRVVLLDFGVATELSRNPRAPHDGGEVVGTARYMAPEQADDSAPLPVGRLMCP